MASSKTELEIGLNTDTLSSESLSLNTKILKPLDEVLRCHICFEYFTNCMITKCSHNYCSLCIRRYMAYKSQCPTCFQAATEPELQNNRLIDEIVRIYTKIRESLHISFESVEKSCSDLPSSSKIESTYDSKKPIKVETPTPRSITRSTVFDGANEVSCPVCYFPIECDKINSHLDTCLKQADERTQKKFLPKLVYHLLTEKQIKKKLKDHGLSVSGDRQTLIRRHKNFIVLYNANCDSLNPRPVQELLYDIERQELEERLNSVPRTTPINRGDLNVVEKHNETYVQEHKSQFNALMQNVQLRELNKSIIKKKDDDCGAFMTCKMVDNSGKKIGETSLQITKVEDLGTVNVKQEVSDSPPSTPSDDDTSGNDEKAGRNPVIENKKHNTGKQTSNKPVPFRIKKKVPIKLKGQSLLGTSDDDSSTDSLSSLEDFRPSKVKQTQSHLKKKNVRKLSVGDGDISQRKK